MAGKETDHDNSSVELSEGDERRESEWEEAGSGKAKKAKSRKRKKKGNVSSTVGSEGEERVGEENAPKAGLINIVVRFEGEGGGKEGQSD